VFLRTKASPPAEEPRTSVSIRFSAAERAALEQAAAREGQTFGDYVRRSALRAALARSRRDRGATDGQ
jgi:uncharacterized protein (DUF1778 family)